jgi:hypothetical protein
MKFAIGIESFADTTFGEPMLEIPEYTGTEAMVYDNEVAIETTEFNAYFESVSTEFDITARNLENFYQETEVSGTEADDEKKKEKDNKKKAWYKRLWESICNMFKAIGKWFSNAWTWIASKFKKGGEKDAAEAAKEEVKMKAEAAEKVEEKMEEKGGLTPEEIKTYTETILKQEAAKSEMAKKMFSAPVIKQMAKEVAEQVIKNAEPAKEQTATAQAAAPASPNPPRGGRLVPKSSGKYKLEYYLFNDRILGGFTGAPKKIERISSNARVLSSLQDFVRYNAETAVSIVFNSAYMIGLAGGHGETSAERAYNEVKKLIPDKKPTVHELTEIAKYIDSKEKEVKDAVRDGGILKLQRYEVEFDKTNGRIKAADLERLVTGTEEYKKSQAILSYIIDFCSYIKSVSTSLVANVDSMYNKLKSGEAVYDDVHSENETENRALVFALKNMVVKVKNIGTTAVKAFGKTANRKSQISARNVADAQGRAD